MAPHVDDTLKTTLEKAPSSAARADILLRYMEQRGEARYDESVTQLEHALQCAYLARQAGAASTTIAAALLHDIGHFITDETDAHGDFALEDWSHEILGAELVGAFLVEPVTAAIRLHVAAKRYLCTKDGGYLHALSPASQRSFRLQGGNMSPIEVAAFERHPHHRLAVEVRRFDDGAKVAGWDVAALETWRPELEMALIV
jgi:predicted HD phosphohydrolase